MRLFRMTHLLDNDALVSTRCGDIVAHESRLWESDGLRDRVLLIGSNMPGTSIGLVPLTRSVSPLDSSAERGSLRADVLVIASFTPSRVG